MQNKQGCAGIPSSGNISEVYVDTYNTVGSTYGAIIRFSNVRKSIGTALTYRDDAVYGSSVTVNEFGFYAISVGVVGGASATYGGISVNTLAGNTAITTPLTYAQGFRSVTSSTGTGALSSASWSGWLNLGDVIRWHGNGTGPGSGNGTFLSVSKVI